MGEVMSLIHIIESTIALALLFVLVNVFLEYRERQKNFISHEVHSVRQQYSLVWLGILIIIEAALIVIGDKIFFLSTMVDASMVLYLLLIGMLVIALFYYAVGACVFIHSIPKR
jgi:uncharacterized membrane protein YhaH (DUF805 family)